VDDQPNLRVTYPTRISVYFKFLYIQVSIYCYIF